MRLGQGIPLVPHCYESAAILFAFYGKPVILGFVFKIGVHRRFRRLVILNRTERVDKVNEIKQLSRLNPNFSLTLEATN